MESGNPFQTVGAAEEKRCAAVLVRDLDTVSKSISANLSPRHGTYDSSVSIIIIIIIFFKFSYNKARGLKI